MQVIRYLIQISFIIVFFHFFWTNNTHAQQPAYSILGAEALEGVDIYSIVQDKDFNYWIGSDEGLFKHDGYNFELVESVVMRSVSAFNLMCLPNGDVLFNNLNQQVFIVRDGELELFFEIPDTGNDVELKWLSDDEIYLSTSKVVYILNHKGKIIRQFTPKVAAYIGEPMKLDPRTIISYIGAHNAMLVYRNGRFSLEKIRKKDNTDISSLFIYKQGQKLFAIDQDSKSLYHIDSKTWQFENIGNLNWDLNNQRIRLYNTADHIWIANLLNGVRAYGKIQHPGTPAPQWYDNYFISHVYKDLEGNVLLGTFDHGIIVIPSLAVPDVLKVQGTKQVTKLYAGAKGELYIGTKLGGIIKYDDQFSKIVEKGPKAVETLVHWSEQNIILTDNKFVDLRGEKPKISTDNQGSLKDFIQGKEHLVGAFNFGIIELSFDSVQRKFNRATSLHSGRSYAVAYDSIQDIWYGSTAQGLLYSKDLKAFHPIIYKGNIINVGRLVCHKGFCYAFSRQYGLLTIKGTKIVKAVPLFYKGNKVIVSKFIRYRDNWVLATNLGLLSLDKSGHLDVFFNQLGSIQTNRLIDFCIIGETLWIANARGLQQLDLNMINEKLKPPHLVIRKIKINGQTIDSHRHSFDHNERNLTFQFFVPTLRNRESIHYHYRLKGAEENWNINSYENYEARYFSLSPGNYELQVKAENNGVFSPVQAYTFRIAPPFYKSWWFISLGIVVILLSFYFYYRRQLNVQRRKAQQINELNASRLTAIQSQMNPHFIFNSLNSIQDLVLKGDVNNSYTFITKFSNLVRRTLSYSDKDFIEFEQEIKLLELYLSLEKLRFKEELAYTIDTDEVEDDILIPPMLIQPFIENALVHGLLHQKGLKELTIRFYMQSEILVCEVEDNGVGRQRAKEIKERQGSQHESFAVNAIRKRFEILMTTFPSDLGYFYEDLPVGTRVTLRIPVKFQF